MKHIMGIIVLTFAIAISGMAQTKAPSYSYAMVNGKLVKSVGTSSKSKSPDKVYAIMGADTIFQGSKGGLYYYTISKKTGLRYKKYIPVK